MRIEISQKKIKTAPDINATNQPLETIWGNYQ